MRLPLGFNKRNQPLEDWYDLREDWTLIESSFAKQYGIRIRQQADMPWAEFCSLVGGLMPDTPLGQVVEIRAEKDAERLKAFSPSQSKIHSDWEKKQLNKRLENQEQLNKDMDSLTSMISSLFGKG